MSDIHVDERLFETRIARLRDAMDDNSHELSKVDGVLVIIDQTNEENPYTKSSTLHTWLFGYEFPRSILFLSKSKMLMLSSPKKISYLEHLKTDLEIRYFTRTKDKEQNKTQMSELAEMIKSCGTKIGVFSKELPSETDGMPKEWAEIIKIHEFSYIDVALAIQNVLSIKMIEEVHQTQLSSEATSLMMSKGFVQEMSETINNEKSITHSDLSNEVEKKIESNSIFKKVLKVDPKFKPDLLEWCYNPIIMSGGTYDLKPSAVSDSKKLHAGVIIAELGLRYKAYCSNIGRTFLIDPNESQEQNYHFLKNLQQKVIDAMKPGVLLCDIYKLALGIVQQKNSALEPHFVKSLGAGIGIEFRDSSMNINLKNERSLREGMTFSLSIGFQNIENPKPQDVKSKYYSLLLIDTVHIGPQGAMVLTDSPKNLEEISFSFNESESNEESEDYEKSTSGRPVRSTDTRRTRQSDRAKNESSSNDAKRRVHQKELASKVQAEGLKKFQENDHVPQQNAQPKFKKFESYKRESQLPAAVADLKIQVDSKSQSIIVPVEGRPVPFHITILKNVSKSEDDGFCFLRLNLVTPGQGAIKKDEQPFDDSNATFIRSLTYKSSDILRLSQVYSAIQEMKKNATKREAEKKELADVVEQENLIEDHTRRNVLREVFVRPGLDGKRVPGQLEVHQNGLRYQSPLRVDHKIDIIYSNIHHLFFQPNDHELITIIHFHLKTPIIVGKRKTYDIQIYREASDVQYDETGVKKRKYRYGDDDELEQEQEEQRRRKEVNKEFHVFADKIAELSGNKVEVDIPFRELGFYGVPFRSNVLLQPTTECLIQLIDPPFTVLTISEIEIAHFERVQFGLKNFDMVFVFKDYTKAPVHINTIPAEQLDHVKDWLDSVDIPFTEGPLNLNWSTILKTVNEDPLAFFETGGWGFLGSDSEEEAATSSAESEYSEDSIKSEESYSEESDFEEEDEEEEDEDEEEEEEEEGEDWDELEEKAKKEDIKGNDTETKRRKR